MNSIIWPEQYTPGATDNYVSNEVIVPGLSAAEIWPFLDTPSLWPSYYANAADVAIYGNAGPGLAQGLRFRFTTFGFLVEGEVVEHVPPAPGAAARVAWHGWVEGGAEERLDVHHAWLIEDLDGGRVRVLTQESQLGEPARDLASTTPNPMLNAHQAWLDGLVAAVRKARG